MDNRKIQYILVTLAILLALVGSYFGVKLPVPEFPTDVVDELGMSRGLNEIRFRNPVQMDQTLDVIGATTVTGALAVTGAQTFTGALAANGGITVDTTNFTVDGTSGAVSSASSVSALSAAIGGGFGANGCSVSSAGVLQCDGAATLGSTLLVTDTVTLVGALAQSQVNSAGGSANPYDYTGTLGIMNNSDDFTLFDVNITNANHTGSSNTVQALDIAGITADAEATEIAIKVGSGWDYALDLDGNAVVVGADGGVTLDETSDDVVALTMGAGAGTFSVLTGNAKIGNGSPTQTQDGEDAYVESTFEVDGSAYFDGAVLQSQVNAAGAGANPWDYTGTLGAMTDGDDFTLLDINITNANHTGTTSAVQALDIAGISADAEATETAIKVGAGWDYGLDLDGNVVVLGADGGVTLDETADDAVSLTFGAGAGKFTVATGNLQVGSGSPGVALNGEDAYVTGTFEVDGAAQFDGAVTTNSTLAADGGISVDTSNFTVSGTTGAVVSASTVTAAGATMSGDVTISAASDGGNKGVLNELTGLPRVTMVGVGQMADGSSTTVLTDFGDSETPATKWTKVSAGTSITSTNTSDYWKQGSASLKVEIGADAVAGEGITNALASGDQNWTDDEGFGFWVYSTKALDSADLALRIADATAGGGYTAVDLPAVTANKWQWVTLDVTLGNNNLKDAITDLSLALSAAGQAKAAAGAFVMYFDFFVKWDADDEEALGMSILQDGVLALTAITVTDVGAGSATQVLYTNYFVDYASAGNETLVPITDLADAAIAYMVLVAY